VIQVKTDNFAEAHRQLTLKVLACGDTVPTDYDKDDEALSRDAPAVVVVREPWKEQRMATIFSKAVYDTPKSLMAYAEEIVHGTMDELTEKLSYTYHDRYKDQMEGVLEELERNLYTRRAQMITWRPGEDLGAKYPPCFQRAWFRMRGNKLAMHTHWRSRDVWKAWGSNVFGFAHLHLWVSAHLGLHPGEYIEFIDSAHIYGRDLEKAQGAVLRDDWGWTLWDIRTG